MTETDQLTVPNQAGSRPPGSRGGDTQSQKSHASGKAEEEKKKKAARSPYGMPADKMTAKQMQMVNPEEQKKEAERVYRRIYDVRKGELKANGEMVCQMANVDPETLVPLELAHFVEEQGGDERLGKLHLEHYNKKRVKSLLKVNQKLAEMGAPSSAPAPSNFLTQGSSPSPKKASTLTVAGDFKTDNHIQQLAALKTQKKALHLLNKSFRQMGESHSQSQIMSNREPSTKSLQLNYGQHTLSNTGLNFGDRNLVNQSMMLKSTQSNMHEVPKRNIILKVNAEMKKKRETEKKRTAQIKEQIEIRKVNAVEMNKKVPDALEKKQRSCQSLDMLGRKRYTTDMKEYMERMSEKEQKMKQDEKQKFNSFFDTHYEQKRRASPDGTVWAEKVEAKVAEDYDDMHEHLKQIEAKIENGKYRALYRAQAKREDVIGKNVRHQVVDEQYQKLNKEQEQKQLQIFKGMIDRQKKLEQFFKEQKLAGKYNAQAVEAKAKGKEMKMQFRNERMKQQAQKLRNTVQVKNKKAMSMIQSLAEEKDYESMIKAEQAKLKRDEICDSALDNQQKLEDKQAKVIEKHVHMQRQLLLNNLQKDVHQQKVTEFNKMKQAAYEAQKELHANSINAEHKANYNAQVRLAQQADKKKHKKTQLKAAT